MTEQIPSREILWNITHPANIITMYLLMTISLCIAAVGVIKRIKVWQGGNGKIFQDNPLAYIKAFLIYVLGQAKTLSAPIQGIMHSLIFIGFIVLLIATTSVFIEHDLGIEIYRGNYYLVITLLSDVLGFGLLVGLIIAAYRRYISKQKMLHNPGSDLLVIALLGLLIIQGFVLEGARIAATSDPWKLWSPVGYIMSVPLSGLSQKALSSIHFYTWWFHTITVFVSIAIFPYTKLFHIISTPLNLMANASNVKGKLPPMADISTLIEEAEEEDFSLGYGKITDYSSKNLLDLDACTECGRCQDACPAYATGKPLSPKWVILDTKSHMRAIAAKNEETSLPRFLNNIDSMLTRRLELPLSGLTEDGNGAFVSKNGGKHRADNEGVQKSLISAGSNSEALICGEVISRESFESCTTCGACVEVCPAGIDHIDHIIQNRRYSVMIGGEVNREAQSMLRALENRGNPYGPQEDRTKWCEGLDVPVIEEGGSCDVLYWVGCATAFDPEKQKIGRALVKIMRASGINFGILGTKERCTGDHARRLGEENLFQTLAKENIAVLNSIKCSSIVTNCPHCYNTLLKEYPDYGLRKNIPVIHHSALIERLLSEGKLKLSPNSDNSVTFHDPCYLGRHNGIYDAPRAVISAATISAPKEMPMSKSDAMCCGAGGGHFWMDLKIGERINTERAKQAVGTGASCIATGCPFCKHMLQDGLKLLDAEEKMEVKDIAEIVAERL
ncbi:MAG: 4Fe-4S dicluster domain-containing protein [Candidatus Dadabacteria bacterium]|nr:MAG: 4Fe-4S dicluster domain-containing protein [Candidatus Dadabacteria bacterium]